MEILKNLVIPNLFRDPQRTSKVNGMLKQVQHDISVKNIKFGIYK